MRTTIGGLLVGLLAATAGGQDDAAKKLAREMEGKYKLVGLELEGKKQDPKPFGEEFVVRGDQLIAIRAGKPDPIRFTLDPTKKPAEINFEEKKSDGTVRKTYGIFKFENGELIICVSDSTDPAKRPKEFRAPTDDLLLMTLRRVDR